MDILVTNDDGIHSRGIRVLAEALSDVGDVFVVAPAEDQSSIGRALSDEVEIEEDGMGFAIHGTPADCVVAGLEALGPYPDMVVAGVNEGANLGEYVLGRSGTVSAAVEAAFFGVPAIAASLYIPDDTYPETPPTRAFDDVVAATQYLAANAVDAGVFERAGYLNVNAAPTGEDPARIVVTTPTHTHYMDASRDGAGTVRLEDHVWERMRTGDIDDPPGTDRRAVLDGHVSVSPLTAPHSTEQPDALEALADEYPGRSA